MVSCLQTYSASPIFKCRNHFSSYILKWPSFWLQRKFKPPYPSLSLHWSEKRLRPREGGNPIRTESRIKDYSWWTGHCSAVKLKQTNLKFSQWKRTLWLLNILEISEFSETSQLHYLRISFPRSTAFFGIHRCSTWILVSCALRPWVRQNGGPKSLCCWLSFSPAWSRFAFLLMTKTPCCPPPVQKPPSISNITCNLTKKRSQITKNPWRIDLSIFAQQHKCMHPKIKSKHLLEGGELIFALDLLFLWFFSGNAGKNHTGLCEDGNRSMSYHVPSELNIFREKIHHFQFWRYHSPLALAIAQKCQCYFTRMNL